MNPVASSILFFKNSFCPSIWNCSCPLKFNIVHLFTYKFQSNFLYSIPQFHLVYRYNILSMSICWYTSAYLPVCRQRLQLVARASQFWPSASGTTSSTATCWPSPTTKTSSTSSPTLTSRTWPRCRCCRSISVHVRAFHSSHIGILCYLNNNAELKK